ncbi:xanthine dehydrogenase family protein molybdopterin-binding subunit [Oligoflexaceae bacterium]|nr:xanthine dehydrogenase family protein molybdopterin-binding subunit [Oligoflexaceae bacterium]
MKKIFKVDRRDFLKATGQTTAYGLVLGFQLPASLTPAALAANKKAFRPSVFIGIAKSGAVEMTCHRSEMGQGVRTSLPMILAEEMGADFSKIVIKQALGDSRYGDQNTDGSTSVRVHWEILREAGATARDMLILAAANKHKLSVSDLSAENSFVIHKKSGKQFSFASLAADAATVPVPKEVKLKSPAQFKLIGRSQKMHDLPNITKGRANYGIDAIHPDMVYASIERSPVYGGKIKSVDSSAANKVKGVLKTIRVDQVSPGVNCHNGVAIVANNSWTASKARESLKIKWDLPKSKRETTTKRQADFAKAMKAKKINYKNSGATPKGLVKLNVGQGYETPYLVHAPMEPLVCLAEVQKNSCEIWAPVQDPQRAQKAVAAYLKIPEAKVKINVTLLGGGFGRKSQPDFILEAVQISKKMKKPVKLQWTREDEVQFGFYHADSFQKIDVWVDKDRKSIKSWKHTTSFPTIMTLFNPKADQAADWEVGMGPIEFPYDVPHVQVDHAPVASSVKIGWFRAVCHVWHAFAMNSCLDEVAHELKVDPIKFRLSALGKDRLVSFNPREKDLPYKQHTKRIRQSIETLQRNISWKPKKGKNRGMGFAVHYSFYSYIAMAVDAEVIDGKVKVHQVDVAVDAGTLVNPDTVRAQMEGAVVFGLSAALYGKITLDGGKVMQSNFHDYPMLRHNEMPKVNVYLVSSSELPTGIGEPGVPPVAPALCNAIFAATGKRIRSLPISDQKLS